jgi:hypothetical protein
MLLVGVTHLGAELGCGKLGVWEFEAFLWIFRVISDSHGCGIGASYQYSDFGIGTGKP